MVVTDQPFSNFVKNIFLKGFEPYFSYPSLKKQRNKDGKEMNIVKETYKKNLYTGNFETQRQRDKMKKRPK